MLKVGASLECVEGKVLGVLGGTAAWGQILGGRPRAGVRWSRGSSAPAGTGWQVLQHSIAPHHSIKLSPLTPPPLSPGSCRLPRCSISAAPLLPLPLAAAEAGACPPARPARCSLRGGTEAQQRAVCDAWAVARVAVVRPTQLSRRWATGGPACCAHHSSAQHTTPHPQLTRSAAAPAHSSPGIQPGKMGVAD